MSKKRTKYTIEFKTKIVLEVLKNDKTINEIAAHYNITPKNIQNWKKIFLSNAELAMEPAKAVKEYKDEIVQLKHKNDRYAKAVGNLTVEKDWLMGKLRSLGLSKNRQMVEPKLKTISLLRQTKLLGIDRTYFYYKPKVNQRKIAVKNHIKKVFTSLPIYGERKVHQQLLADGYNVSLNTVSKYRKELGLRAVLAVRSVSTTISDDNHPKYPYKLRDIKIMRANQVWSADITYIKLKGGMVYLAAIIDWHSKAVLSWRIANVMDTQLVMDTLNESLSKYNKPEIFNTDQGSQYTSLIHTKTLQDNGITISMDGKGRATDNIAIERFWRSVKCERIYLNEYHSIDDLKTDVKDYIEFYNEHRFHQTLGYKKPMQVYNQSLNLTNKTGSKAA
jgi:putative transposase